MDSSVVRLDDTLKGYVLTVQEFAELCVAAFAGAFRRPWYLRDTLYHMDQIGVGACITLVIALLGGFLIANFYLSIDPYFYWMWAFEALRFHDLIYGLIKPTVFGFIICMVGCYAGLNTAGGTVGVGQSTTQAMVTSSILILMTDFFMTKVFVFLG